MTRDNRLFQTGMFIVLLLLTLSPALLAAEIRVPADQPTIQAGIDVAVDGDTVLVADGDYGNTGNRDLDFGGKSITVRSQGGAEACKIWCGGTESENHRGFHFHNGEGRNSVLEGFTIRNGLTNDPAAHWLERGGAGIFCDGASPTIRSCIITSNHSGGSGAGINCINGADALIENCTISVNRISDEFAGDGAGINCFASAPEIINCEIKSNRIEVGYYGSGVGSGICCYYASDALISGCTISHHDGEMACVYLIESSPTLVGNTIRNNSAGGIAVTNRSTALIENNVIHDNFGVGAAWSVDGGGVFRGNVITGNSDGGIRVSSGGSPRLEGNLIIWNRADRGGGCWVGSSATAEFIGCTIAHNQSEEGGGLYIDGESCAVSVTNCIIWTNGAYSGSQVWIDEGQLDVSWSDVQGGEDEVASTAESVLNWGQGMIDIDPLFTTGALGDFYLSHIAAGQAVDSPGIDAGDPTATPPAGTTRTDAVLDAGIVDLGYHYGTQHGEGEPETEIVGGTEGSNTSPLAVFYFQGSDDQDPPSALRYVWRLDQGHWSAPQTHQLASFDWHDLDEGPHTFMVRALDTEGNLDPTPALRQFDHQDWAESSSWVSLAATPGPSPWNPPLVRTFWNQWLAYASPSWGATLACGHLDSDGQWDVITGSGPGPGYGPHVNCYTRSGSSIVWDGFLAYGTASYGVNVSLSDLDGDGDHEIVTGPGPGPVFGPHIRGFEFTPPRWINPIPEVSFFAYGTPRWGVNVAGGDIDGDGFDEIVTGAGPGAVFGPHVRAFDYDGGPNVEPVPGVSYFAYGTHRRGVNVACGDLDGDGIDEIITGPGPSSIFGPHVRAWSCDGAATTPVPGVSFFAYGWRYGVNVSAADIDLDGRDEILTMPGPDPEATALARAWSVEDGTVTLVHEFPAYDAWMTHGGRIAGARAGWNR